MKVFAFDIDETLEISYGPVTIKMMEDLRDEGHAVGLCGNWALFVQRVPNWYKIVSFIGVGLPKEVFLQQFKIYVPAEDHVMVGNRLGRTNSLGVICNSNDEGSAASAGWRFILEDSFAAGQR